jgi:LysM repeat protein
MTTTIIRDPRSGLSFTSAPGRRMYMYTEKGTQTYAFKLAPREIEYGGVAQDWAEAERSGNTPLLMRKADMLDTMSFSFLVVAVNEVQVPVTESLLALKAVAKSRERVLISYSTLESGLWRITDASMSSVLRHVDTNEPTQATVSLSLKRASDPEVAVGPITGGAVATPAPAKPAPPRTYTVVKGDCLWNIAKRYYGNGALWPRIFDANRGQIKDPHWIYPGQRFVIP